MTHILTDSTGLACVFFLAASVAMTLASVVMRIMIRDCH